MLLTFFLAVVGWIIFRAENMSQAYDHISHMFGSLFDSSHIGFEKSAIYWALIMLLIEWLQRDKQHALQFTGRTPFSMRPVRWLIYIAITVVIVCFRGHSQTFIYFQF